MKKSRKEAVRAEKRFNWRAEFERYLKYLSNHRKHAYEVLGKPKNQANRISIDEMKAMKVIMDRTRSYLDNMKAFS